MAKKSWVEKRDLEKEPIVKVLDKRFADMEEGCKMLIATPKIVAAYIHDIPLGNQVELSTMRQDLALTFQADKTCPVTSGIFLRIVAEAAFEEYQKGSPIEQIAPFWRMINTRSKVAQKLACGLDFIDQQRKKEGLN